MCKRGGAWFVVFAGAVIGQTFNNQTLNGNYHFRHLLFTTDLAENINVSSLWGSITFDGNGNYSFSGQSSAGTGAPVAANGSGTYSVSPGGFVTLTNPQNKALELNARWGLVAPGAVTPAGPQPGDGMLIGSSTEGAASTFDLLVAISAGSGTSDASLSGSYSTATLAFPAGAGAQASSSLFSLQANGEGAFGGITIHGHGASLSGGAPVTQSVSGATYAMQADGSGSAALPLQSGFTTDTQLLSGNKTIYLSSSGTVILGGASDGSVQDLMVGFKGSSGLAWTGEFWHAGLRFEAGGFASAYAGSLFSDGSSNLLFTRRLHQLQSTGAVTYDFTGANTYMLQADGTGTAELTNVALGAAGNGLAGAANNPNDMAGFELEVGVRMPAVSGNGVFLNPQGVVNAASFAPAGDSIAPGEFVALFGTGLAASTESASPPYPPVLNGVSVLINGVQAPIYYVSPGLIEALVPYATAGPTATIVVNNKGTASNPVEVPVAATAPGVFSVSRNGLGPGAITHANFSLVTSASPAKAGETVVVYLTGLGAVNPPVADGTAGGANPLSKATVQVNALIGGEPATVSYAGLAPLFPGLYQLNVVVPADLAVTAVRPLPLAIQTADSFHDQVDLIVGP